MEQKILLSLASAYRRPPHSSKKKKLSAHTILSIGCLA